MQDLQALMKPVRQALRPIAEFAEDERLKVSASAIKSKTTEKDLVSYVDEQCEKRLVDALSKILPEAGIIAEEHHQQYKDGLNWIIDPIDGTTNYLHGVPHYAISVALAQNDEILLGLVKQIHTADEYHTAGKGPSFKNEQKLKIPADALAMDSLVATGFSVKNHQRLEDNLRRTKWAVENTRGVRRIGSAALDLCYTAEGIFNLFFETDLSAWDVAAGALIVQNAGGIVSDFHGKNQWLFGDEIVAGSPHIHANFLENSLGNE